MASPNVIMVICVLQRGWDKGRCIGAIHTVSSKRDLPYLDLTNWYEQVTLYHQSLTDTGIGNS